jgi:serine phosphatase RsbU (regulator of sigma subunit)
MVERVNALLYAQNAASMFTTLLYGVLDLSSRRLDYVSCGHPPPLIARAGGQCLSLVGGGTPLGILPDKRAIARSVDLVAGDRLLLCTDGIIESIDASGAEYGEERLSATLLGAAAGTSNDVARAVIDSAVHFAEGVEQFDDITCLVVVVN